MKTEKILCDFCEREIEKHPHMRNQFLTLNETVRPQTSNFSWSMCFYPLIDREQHFCGLMCLYKWLQKKLKLPEPPHD